MILQRLNPPLLAYFEVELLPEHTYAFSFGDQSCLHLYCFYGLSITLKQNFLSIYENPYGVSIQHHLQTQ